MCKETNGAVPSVVVISLLAGGMWLAGAGAPQQRESTGELRRQARAALAKTTGEVKVPGLAQPVEVIRDAWGVPHIYAKTQADLFFAQGFVVAQDRLWQLDLWRRKAMGELAAVLGPDAVERDRYARLLRYRGNWRAEWISYSPDTKQIAEAFTRGINAFIASIGDDLPLEFKLTGTRPGMWTPEVVVSRMAAYPMTGNAARELSRAVLVNKLGPEHAAKLFPTDPPRIPRPEEGLSLDGLDTNVIAGLEKAAGEVSYDGATESAGSDRVVENGIPELNFEIPEGSNNWTIAGAKTKSGKPILANDPHRALLLPSLRYIVHLVGPGWNVIGAGEPALPGVSIGHNQRIAFGLTIFSADQQDIVVERVNAAGDEYFDPAGPGGWQRIEVLEEEIAVKGEAKPRRVQLKYTRHGPVIYEDAKRRRAYVLRWVGTEPGTAGYLAGIAVSRAQNWTEFRQALEQWKLPPENFVYADVDGNIGYQAAGLVPARGCAGLVPARGDIKTCEWRGFLSLDELPHEYNPAPKFFATANDNTLPRGEKKLIGFEWAPEFRAKRIREVLAAGNGLTIADSARLQGDVASLSARELLPLVGEIPAGNDRRRQAAELLKRWDARMEKDSAAAAIFEVWADKLRDPVYKPLLPEELWRAARRAIPLTALIRVLREADPEFFSGGNAKTLRDLALATALDEAIAELEKRLGTDMTNWRWGALHTATFAHPLGSELADERGAFNRGPVERAGDGTTVNATSGANFKQSAGASYREVIDLADWDNSLASNVPGQSGQPESPFYDDLLELWARDAHFPMVYSRAAVEKSAMLRMLLLPATR